MRPGVSILCLHNAAYVGQAAHSICCIKLSQAGTSGRGLALTGGTPRLGAVPPCLVRAPPRQKVAACVRRSQSQVRPFATWTWAGGWSRMEVQVEEWPSARPQ
jgi:hypothetical protein